MTRLRQEADNITALEIPIRKGPTEPIKLVGSNSWLRRMQRGGSEAQSSFTKARAAHPPLYDALTEAEQREEVLWQVAISGVKSLMSTTFQK